MERKRRGHSLFSQTSAARTGSAGVSRPPGDLKSGHFELTVSSAPPGSYALRRDMSNDALLVDRSAMRTTSPASPSSLMLLRFPFFFRTVSSTSPSIVSSSVASSVRLIVPFRGVSAPRLYRPALIGSVNSSPSSSPFEPLRVLVGESNDGDAKPNHDLRLTLLDDEGVAGGVKVEGPMRRDGPASAGRRSLAITNGYCFTAIYREMRGGKWSYASGGDRSVVEVSA